MLKSNALGVYVEDDRVDETENNGLYILYSELEV